MAPKGRIQLKVEKKNSKVVMHLNGDLDGSSACQVEHVLERLHNESEGARLILDLCGVRNFEFFGIATFAKVVRSQRKHFHEISLTGLQPSAENVFKRFGLESRDDNKM